jgi:glycosyltransferase involved in cell wall biosynthesis
MDLSLVISTRNRAAQLEQALESYARLQYQGAWELVIVDNGSSDATPQLLEAFGRRFSGNVRVLQHARPGLGAARNVGWRAAGADIVAFTDDDCYPQQDYLARIDGCFSDPRYGFVGGRVLLHDPSDYPITIQLSDQLVEFPPKSYIAPGEVHGANFAFRRQALEAIGGFDERLGAGTKYYSAEDTDAMARVSGMVGSVRSRAHRVPSPSPAGREGASADAEGAWDRDRGVLHQMPRQSGDAPEVSVSMAQRHGASGRQKELVAGGGSVALPGV